MCLQFAFLGGEYTKESLVKTIAEKVGYAWSRSTLDYLIEFDVVRSYTDTSKPGAVRKRLVFGQKAIEESLIFLVTRDNLAFMSRGKNSNELDEAAGKDTLKYRLASNAQTFLKKVKPSNFESDVKTSDVEKFLNYLNADNSKIVAEYLKANNYLGAVVQDNNGNFSAKLYQELEGKFKKVLLCYFFFGRFFSGYYCGKKRLIDASWDFFSSNVLSQPKINLSSELDANSFSMAACLLSDSSFNEGLLAFSAFMSSCEPSNAPTYIESLAAKDELIAYAKLAVALDNKKHFFSKMCYFQLVEKGIKALGKVDPDRFALISSLVLLTATYCYKNITADMNLHKKFKDEVLH